MNGNGQLDTWDDVVDEVTPDGDSVDLWGLLVRRKWLIFIGAVIGLVLGSLYYARTKPTYESHAQLLIQAKMTPLPVEGMDTQLRYAASMLDHAFVITSPSIVAMAVAGKSTRCLALPGNVRQPGSRDSRRPLRGTAQGRLQRVRPPLSRRRTGRLR